MEQGGSAAVRPARVHQLDAKPFRVRPMIDLASMSLDDGVPIEAVADYLDRLSHASRRDACALLGRKHQRGLYRKALAAPKITMSHFVPDERKPLQSVRHYGKNTLPLPGKHRYFEKRFCRPEDREEELYGYNEAPSRSYVGPGYFVAISTDGKPEWQARGPIVVDYFQVPSTAVASGWPKVIPNNKGLQVIVYNKTRDFMRKVSEHLSIGAAFKGEKALDHYFVLVREE